MADPHHPARRHCLRTLAAGPLALGVSALGLPAALAAAATNPIRGDAGRFTRLFPQLPPFAEPSPPLVGALVDLGRPGGLMDANDPLAAGPTALIADPALSANNPNAALPGGAAGTTFLGQFVDHDITFDATSPLGRPMAPQAAVNARVPALDLDSVYGRGPVVDPHLYDPQDRALFRVENGGLYEDLPRLANGIALIADPRNDEHVILAGLHAAIMLLHNHVVARVRATGETDPARVFARARRIVTWHYQWIVLRELLPSFVGAGVVDEVQRSGRRWFRAREQDEAAVPVEFQGAAYRFGHSIVRPSYRANLKGDNGRPFFGFVFDPRAEGQADPEDLRGGARAPRRFVGWQTFFDFGDGELRPRKLIDTRISTPLMRLPLGAIATGDAPTALPQRNLLRHLTWQLPSGQAVAQAMGQPALRAGDFAELAVYGLGLEHRTPLWYYLLREAHLSGGGQTLGPVGGRIVAEVIVGLMQCDPAAWLRAAPEWRPTLPSRLGRGEFDIVDLLTLAGVSPAHRGQ